MRLKYFIENSGSRFLFCISAMLNWKNSWWLIIKIKHINGVERGLKVYCFCFLWYFLLTTCLGEGWDSACGSFPTCDHRFVFCVKWYKRYYFTHTHFNWSDLEHFPRTGLPLCWRLYGDLSSCFFLYEVRPLTLTLYLLISILAIYTF